MEGAESEHCPHLPPSRPSASASASATALPHPHHHPTRYKIAINLILRPDSFHSPIPDMCEPVTVAVRFLPHQSIQALPPTSLRDVYSVVSTPSTFFKLAPHTIFERPITRRLEPPSTYISTSIFEARPCHWEIPCLTCRKGTTSSMTSTVSPPLSALSFSSSFSTSLSPHDSVP